MNRSFSKIRHIQEANQRLEKRLMSEQQVPYTGQTINPGDQIIFMDSDTAELNKYFNKKENPVSSTEPVQRSRKEIRQAEKQSQRDWELKMKKYAEYEPTKEEVINEELKKKLEGKTFQLYSDPNYSEGNQSQMSNLVKITKVRMPFFPGTRIGEKQNYNLWFQDMGYKGSDPQKNMGEFFKFSDGESRLTFTCSYSNKIFADYVGSDDVAVYNKQLLEILRNTACN